MIQARIVSNTRGDCGARSIGATFHDENAKCIGSCKLFLVKPPYHNFHESCDAETQDLLSVGLSYCDRQGHPKRVKQVREAVDDPEESAKFVYIDTFRMHHVTEKPESEEECSELGAKAIRALLNTSPIAGNWTLATYIACMDVHGTDEVRREGAKADSRQFLRAGFRQTTDLKTRRSCYDFFAVPSFLLDPIMSHGSALAVEIDDGRNTTEDRNPTGLDKELFEATSMELESSPGMNIAAMMIGMGGGVGAQGPSAQFQSRVDQLVANGASIERSHVLHLCAANDKEELLDFFLNKLALMPDANVTQAVNAIEENGWTPLMLAASTILAHRSNANTEVRPTLLHCCQKLIASGADKNIRTFGGMTAVGKMWESAQSISDMRASFGMRQDAKTKKVERDEIYLLEILLMPAGGPTEADLAAGESVRVHI